MAPSGAVIEIFYSKILARDHETKFVGLLRITFVVSKAVLDHNFRYQKAFLLITMNFGPKGLLKALDLHDTNYRRHVTKKKRKLP